MAYSGINVDQDDSAELVSGGAIMDAVEGKDPSKSIPKKKSKKKAAPKKKKKEEDEESEEATPAKDDEEKQAASKSKTKTKSEFLDSVLESTISNKKTSSDSSKLNSFEKQQ